MTCEHTKPELIGFHFGTLTANSRDAVEAHLRGCSQCVTEFLELNRYFETDAESGPDLSSGHHARLRARMAKAIDPKSSARWWQTPLTFGAAAAVVLLALVMTYEFGSGNIDTRLVNQRSGNR